MKELVRIAKKKKKILFTHKKLYKYKNLKKNKLKKKKAALSWWSQGVAAPRFRMVLHATIHK